MQPAVLVRLRPTGPWRYGPEDGDRDRVDALYRSDRLFSAITLAMRQFGWLEEWLDASARASVPAVVFSSLFPYQANVLFAPPPSHLWPPPASLLTSPSPVFLSKMRWSAARFVPLSLIESMLAGQTILADQWLPDAESGCLLRRDRASVSPVREVIRRSAAVDRAGRGAVSVHSAACVEFESQSGLWCIARFADSAAQSIWSDRVKACFRLLADSGFGGRKTAGWGQAEPPQFQDGAWPTLLLKSRAATNGDNRMSWLLSVYSPASNDHIDWRAGDYRLVTRGGRVESGAHKKTVRMVAEGSVLATREEPVGAALDVAPEGFAHPVYRSGFALALELPSAVPADLRLVETPADKDAPEPRLCPEPAVEERAQVDTEADEPPPQPETEAEEPPHEV